MPLLAFHSTESNFSRAAFGTKRRLPSRTVGRLPSRAREKALPRLMPNNLEGSSTDMVRGSESPADFRRACLGAGLFGSRP
jgi:hypothetical protein